MIRLVKDRELREEEDLIPPLSMLVKQQLPYQYLFDPCDITDWLLEESFFHQD